MSCYESMDYILKKYPKAYSQVSVYHEENMYIMWSDTGKSTKHSITDSVNYYAYNGIWENYNFSDLEDLNLYLKRNRNTGKEGSFQSYDKNLREENLLKHFNMSDVRAETCRLFDYLIEEFNDDELKLSFSAKAKNISELTLNSENSLKHNRYFDISAAAQVTYNQVKSMLLFYRQNGLLSFDEVYDSINRHAQYLKKCSGQVSCDSAAMVFDEELSAFFFHEVVGHLMEAELSDLNNNTFYNYLGRKLSVPQLSIYDNGNFSPHGMAMVFDDEGIKYRNTELISNGTINRMLFSRNCSMQIDEQPTGNGRRSSFYNRPRTRMTNIVVSEGDTDIHDLIAGIENGFFCVGCNSASSSLQMFSLFPREVYLVENGRITEPLLPVAVRGNPVDALDSIIGIGNKSRTYNVFCRKYAEQPLYMTAASPAVALRNLNIRRLY